MCVLSSSWAFVLISYCAYLNIYVWYPIENRRRNKLSGPVASAKLYRLVWHLGREFMAGYAVGTLPDRLISVSFAFLTSCVVIL